MVPIGTIVPMGTLLKGCAVKRDPLHTVTDIGFVIIVGVGFTVTVKVKEAPVHGNAPVVEVGVIV